MVMIWLAVLVALLSPLQSGSRPPSDAMRSDVDRLVQAAEKLEGTWPTQPPPAIAEVATVARHGKAVVPLLIALLSDDPNAESDRKRWKVQQQVALALSRIYSDSEYCGRIYCDGDPPERIGHVKEGWLRVIAADAEMQSVSAGERLDRFKQEKMFFRQFEIGRAIASANDRGAIAELEAWLTHEDRHVRGNVAFVLEKLGDPRGFPTITAILADRSTRAIGQGIPAGRPNVQAQIRSDRYYAAHLLGDLKDRRGVPVLIALLDDDEIGSIVPWSLAEIGDPSAIGPLIQRTDRDDPSARVLAIYALEKLEARDALPRLRELLQDDRRSNFGDRTTVAEAARHAIATISQRP